MAQPYLGQLLLASFNFAPRGYAECNGQLLAISQNQALFSLLGVTYGGDGRTTFGLPNLQGRVPIHVGGGYVQGQMGGSTTVTLSVANLPSHIHTLSVSSGSNGELLTPLGNTVGAVTSGNAYAATSNATMATAALSSVGGGQAHNNMSPYLVLNWCIALQGIFPSRN